MALHFTREEFDDRGRRALAAMAARRLDALLMFKQESIPGRVSFGLVNALLFKHNQSRV